MSKNTRVVRVPQEWVARAETDLGKLGYPEDAARDMIKLLAKNQGTEVDRLAVAFILVFPQVRGNAMVEVISSYMDNLARIGIKGTRWALEITARKLKLSYDPHWATEFFGKLMVRG